LVKEKIKTEELGKDWKDEDYESLKITDLTNEQLDLITSKKLFIRGNKLEDEKGNEVEPIFKEKPKEVKKLEKQKTKTAIKKEKKIGKFIRKIFSVIKIKDIRYGINILRIILHDGKTLDIIKNCDNCREIFNSNKPSFFCQQCLKNYPKNWMPSKNIRLENTIINPPEIKIEHKDVEINKEILCSKCRFNENDKTKKPCVVCYGFDDKFQPFDSREKEDCIDCTYYDIDNNDAPCNECFNYVHWDLNPQLKEEEELGFEEYDDDFPETPCNNCNFYWEGKFVDPQYCKTCPEYENMKEEFYLAKTAGCLPEKLICKIGKWWI